MRRVTGFPAAKQKEVLSVLTLNTSDGQELQEPPSCLADTFKLLPLTAQSHQGRCMTLIRKECLGPEIKLGRQDVQGPCILTHISIRAVKGREFHLVLINGHLAPFKEGESKRFQQVAEALDKARVLCPYANAYLIAGDMNMRENETAPMCSRLGLVDGWEATGKPQRHRYTWDTTRNLYYENGMMYKARYDRLMWTRNSEVSVRWGLQVIDKSASEDPHCFFSDHFGLLVQLDLGDQSS
ncbi:hypothetical protein DUNSADRAFT_4117 [Dunaliella salina]|uniref:Endonuclease/exonuclease/phosphatase domain-containing protein n=1 Tax=Dunaliella salina TaxID=3046 RepID=A0ABQ7GSM6_DUNSA|nr:hypothetical protein DUNSADRAFT_4117 [Dunaliella salina]|eukprot:KAF5837614.1 hypothetical protein DUNSADRAFT_4117 [Dunaliella salina]